MVARRLDHVKGGFYKPDPARIQKTKDFLSPDDIVISRGKRVRGTWSKIFSSLRHQAIDNEKHTLSQAQLLRALGIPKRQVRLKGHAEILKGLFVDGLLLKNGKPNLKHPRVWKIAARQKPK